MGSELDDWGLSAEQLDLLEKDAIRQISARSSNQNINSSPLPNRTASYPNSPSKPTSIQSRIDRVSIRYIFFFIVSFYFFRNLMPFFFLSQGFFSVFHPPQISDEYGWFGISFFFFEGSSIFFPIISALLLSNSTTINSNGWPKNCNFVRSGGTFYVLARIMRMQNYNLTLHPE